MLQRIEAAAQRLGFQNRSDVIKLCLLAFLNHFEKHGSECLPLDYKEILRQDDGRTTRYQRARRAGNHVAGPAKKG